MDKTIETETAYRCAKTGCGEATAERCTCGTTCACKGGCRCARGCGCATTK